MEKTTKYTNCLNCNKPFHEEASRTNEIYCTYCGQSSRESRLSFRRLLNDAISNVFNLDSRLIHTFRDIFFPSKLTCSYIEGRRKYYVNPARLFIFMLIGLITLSLITFKIENNAMGVDRIYTKAERSKMLDDFDALVDTLDIQGHEAIVDSVRKKLFRRVQSTKKDTLGKDGPTLFRTGKKVEDFGISTYDGLHMTQNEIFEKYKVENFWDKLNVGQFIRFVTNPAGGIKYAIKNLTWAVFLTVILMGFFMKLLYIRGSYFIVEHVVLILNSHSLFFFLSALNILFLTYAPLGEERAATVSIVAGLSFTLAMIIQFLSLKRYYQQGIFKTLIKQFLINSAYMFIFCLVVVGVTLISLILY